MQKFVTHFKQNEQNLNLKIIQMKGLANVSLHMWIVPKPHSGHGSDSIPTIVNGTVSVPVCRYVNLVLIPGCKLKSGKNYIIIGQLILIA